MIERNIFTIAILVEDIYNINLYITTYISYIYKGIGGILTNADYSSTPNCTPGGYKYFR